MRKTRPVTLRKNAVKSCTVIIELSGSSAEYTEYILRKALSLSESELSCPAHFVIKNSGMSEECLKICRLFAKEHDGFDVE